MHVCFVEYMRVCFVEYMRYVLWNICIFLCGIYAPLFVNMVCCVKES